MKFFAVISLIAVLLGLASCGGDASEGTGGTAVDSVEKPLAVHITAKQRIARKERRAVAKAEHSKQPAITIARRHGAPPTQLVVRDLRKGTGTPVTRKDAIVVSYFSNTYENALEESKTGRYGPTRFGMNEVIRGWVRGLPGMRVGGRRELIVPKRLGYEGFVTIYVIDLLAVERNGAADF